MVTAGVVMISACTTKPAESGSGATAEPQTSNPNIPAAQDDPVAGSAKVIDSAADGGTADILSVTLTVDASGLTVAYVLSNALPTTGTALLAITVASQDSNQNRQLGAKWINGKAQVFVFDFGIPKQDNLTVTPQQGAAVTVVFPLSSAAGLGESFQWHAGSNVNGEDVDRAPDVGTATFPELP